MILVWFLTISLTAWFAFELGRKWTEGDAEELADAEEERRERGGIRMRSITIRR